MIRRLLGLCIGLMFISFAIPTQAQAFPLAHGCAGGPLNQHGGCIYLENDTGDPLWVQSLQAGVYGSEYTTYCGVYKISQETPNGDVFVVRASKRYCFRPIDQPRGPVYYLYRYYADGTIFCGFNTGYLPQSKGCVKVHR